MTPHKMTRLTTPLLSVLGLATIVLLLDRALSIPDVHFNHTTHECVRVHNYSSLVFGTSEYSCNRLPTRYNLVWVANQ